MVRLTILTEFKWSVHRIIHDYLTVTRENHTIDAGQYHWWIIAKNKSNTTRENSSDLIREMKQLQSLRYLLKVKKFFLIKNDTENGNKYTKLTLTSNTLVELIWV